MKPTVQQMYDQVVAQYKMFAECGYSEYADMKPTLPHCTDLGCYPLVYLDRDNSILCSNCATESLTDPDELDHFKPQSWMIHYEGESLFCENCNTEIESAYGDPS